MRYGIEEDDYVVNLNEIDVPKDWGDDWIDEQDYLTFTGLAHVHREGAAIPFIPVTIETQLLIQYRIPVWTYILLILIVGGLLLAIFYLRKRKSKAKKKLNVEASGERNVDKAEYPNYKFERIES